MKKYETESICTIKGVTRLKTALLALTLVALLSLSGCIEVDYYIKVNRDASADIEYKICFDQIFIG